jgi:hypothetical protein
VGHEPRIVQLQAVPVPLHPRHRITAHLKHYSVQVTTANQIRDYNVWPRAARNACWGSTARREKYVPCTVT